MGLFGTSNGAIMSSLSGQNDAQFKSMNNLLSLQENHVEEFFQYHGMHFISAMEKLMEDVVERVVSQMLAKLEFVTDSNGKLAVHSDALRDYEKITQENIDLDIQNVLQGAIDSEVVNQRKMAKQQYLESQGFGSGQAGMQQGQMPQQYNQMQPNNTGYPVPPSGQDAMGRPYWLDQNGQMSYEPPNSGVHLGQALQKGAAWAKWLM
jgi:hypothetical protein